jgi:hypothetical protein
VSKIKNIHKVGPLPELLPCPFCGCPAEHWEAKAARAVKCTGCGCCTAYMHPEDAAEVWNTRFKITITDRFGKWAARKYGEWENSDGS